MKRANGTGTIVKLSGNRRRPYVVRIPSKDRLGYTIQHALSYHRTAQEAQAALDEYNSCRKANTAPTPDRLSTTFSEIYQLWSGRKYAKAGDASIKSYKASWARLEHLSHLKVRDITLDNLQAVIDHDEANGKSKSTINNDKALMHALLQFALERDIITKDYSDFIQLPHVGSKYEKGSFTDLQIKELKHLSARGTPWADTALILCYTGFRISELLELTPESYNQEGNYLCGGKKTEAGKNRIIPVHPVIKPYLLKWIGKGASTIICTDEGRKISAQQYRTNMFPGIAKEIGVAQATPHWCRHTFSSRLHAAGVRDLEHKRLMGHADKDITAHYTHIDLDQLRSAILMMP